MILNRYDFVLESKKKFFIYRLVNSIRNRIFYWYSLNTRYVDPDPPKLVNEDPGQKFTKFESKDILSYFEDN